MKAILPVAVLVLVCSLGCTKRDNRGRLRIEGTVTFAGQPIEEGKILFEPTVSKLPMASGDIRSGRYELTSDRGPAPGSYLVRFKAYRKKKDPRLDKHPYLGEGQEVGVVKEQFLPKRYSAEPTVTVEIKPDGDGVYDFALER